MGLFILVLGSLLRGFRQEGSGSANVERGRRLGACVKSESGEVEYDSIVEAMDEDRRRLETRYDSYYDVVGNRSGSALS